jgi:hypothetical protein
VRLLWVLRRSEVRGDVTRFENFVSASCCGVIALARCTSSSGTRLQTSPTPAIHSTVPCILLFSPTSIVQGGGLDRGRDACSSTSCSRTLADSKAVVAGFSPVKVLKAPVDGMLSRIAIFEGSWGT